MHKLYNRFSYAVCIMVMLLITSNAIATCTLPAPGGFKSQSVASCQFTVKWKQLNSAVNYTIQYKLNTAPTWTVLSNIGNTTSYTITGLLSSSLYNVKIAGVCSNNETGTYSAPINITTLDCSPPQNLTASPLTASSATIHWTVPCGESKFKLSYRKTGTSVWTNVGNINSTSYMLAGLAANTAYQVKVRSQCGNKPSPFSPVLNFTTLSSSVSATAKNVLLVIIDDARFDSYSATNGPSWFTDSNISRIANEGVNFETSFAVQSQCAPSRGSIITGVYPHIHGVTDNPPTSVSDTITLMTLPQILHNNGYYTGLIGKYHISKNPQPGYDYWMECHNNDYTDTKYNVNGLNITINGHQTDVVTDSALGFLHKVPQGKPFFLWFAYKAPHTPLVPRPQEAGIYDDDEMPFPSNFAKYTKNFPGFIYNCHSSYDSAGVDTYYRGYYELLEGVEITFGKVLNELQTMGIMDSTLIIFMSDNGYMIGEHYLSEKQLAYEESIRIPIFMRYPSLIPAGTKIKNQMAENIDIAPTILDFAGIPDTYGMQGVSLLKLMNNEVTRNEMMYEFFDQSCLPDIRAVRSLDYKYVQYNCSQVTEEFFSLDSLSHENTNQINNPAYATLIQQYRDKLTFWRNYYQDYTWDSLYTCSLTNPQRIETTDGNPLTLINVFPNPAATSFNINFISDDKEDLAIRIMNISGSCVYSETIQEPQTSFFKTFSTASWPAGSYWVLIQHGTHSYHQVFEIQ